MRLILTTLFSCVFVFLTLSISAETFDTPFTFANNTPADANQVNANFEAIRIFLNKINPSGTVQAYMGETVPEGYYECNGQEVSISENPDLYAAIGTMYGSGDGSTTFNLPDLRGMFLRGWSHGSGSDPDASERTDRGDETAGDNVGTKQKDEIIKHSHNYTDPINSRHFRSNFISGSRSNQHATDFHPSSQWNEDVTTETGGAETRPKNINVMYIIKR